MQPYPGAQRGSSLYRLRGQRQGRELAWQRERMGEHPPLGVWRQPIGCGEGRGEKMQTQVSGRKGIFLTQSGSHVPFMMCGGRGGWEVAGRWPRGPA